jgi:hypothetical protein
MIAIGVWLALQSRKRKTMQETSTSDSITKYYYEAKAEFSTPAELHGVSVVPEMGEARAHELPVGRYAAKSEKRKCDPYVLSTLQ